MKKYIFLILVLVASCKQTPPDLKLYRTLDIHIICSNPVAGIRVYHTNSYFLYEIDECQGRLNRFVSELNDPFDIDHSEFSFTFKKDQCKFLGTCNMKVDGTNQIVSSRDIKSYIDGDN